MIADADFLRRGGEGAGGTHQVFHDEHSPGKVWGLS